MKVISTSTLRRRRHGGLMVGAMDILLGLIALCLYSHMGTGFGAGGGGAAEVTSIAALLISFLHTPFQCIATIQNSF